MTFAAIGVAQHATAAGGRGRRLERRRRQRGLGLGFDHRQWIAQLGVAGLRRQVAPLVAVAIEARALVAIAGPVVAVTIVARTLVAIALIAWTLVSWPVIPRAFVTRPIISGPIISGPLISRPLISGPVVSGTLVPGAVVTPAVAAALAVAGAVSVTVFVAWALVAVALLPIAGTFVALLSAVLAILPGRFAALRRLRRVSGGGVSRLCCGLGAFVLEIDVEAGGEVVAAQNLAGRTGGLHGPKQTEIVFGVLQIVFSQHPIASR